ncbi:MAG TPA: CvpA family protein [Novosphingobium sp.]|nr:CvpA family protein [Novosphingobium sp.]HZV09183.1 CvpA family protein [Novosphingobium sp.]
MSGLDILVFGVVGLAAAFGFMRGFVQETLSLAAFVVGVVAIRVLHAPLTADLLGPVGSATGASVLAFLLLLVVPYAATRLLARQLGRAARDSALGPVDRVLGFGFGAVKGALVVVVLFALVALAYDTVWGAAGRPAWMKHARSYAFLDASSEALVAKLAERRRAAAAANTAGDATDDAASDEAASSAPAPAPHRSAVRHHRHVAP